MNIRKILLIAFVFSGMAALIYQLAWIRPLQFLLGSTIYTMSIIFGVFMLGLALGSLIISKYTDKIRNLPVAYALMELGIGFYGVILLSIFNLLPKIYNSLYGLHTNFYLFEVVQFGLVFLVLLIPTTLMGATFPIIAKFYTKEKIGKGVGEVYSANNLGAIIGSFIAGFILIPLFGIKFSIIFAGAINLLVGFTILLISKWKFFKKFVVVTSIVFVFLAFFGNYNIQQMHSGGFYRTSEIQKDLGEVVYYEEGLHSTVTVRRLYGKGYSLNINGYGQGSSEINDLRVNYLLSYLPLLISPESENSLVIGLGTGTTSGQLAQHIEVTTIELEQAVLKATDYFTTFNLNVLENPNHSIVINDARNFLLKENKKYDLIIAEPTNTWQSFSTQLYSKEFFELVKEDLNEDGLFVKWVPIYTMSVEDFRSFYKTFNLIFPNNVGFANIKYDEDTPVKFETSEILIIGSQKEIDLSKIDLNYKNLPIESKQYLDGLRLSSGEEISHLLLFTDEQIQGYAENAEIVTDDKPILEFSTAKKVLMQDPRAVIEDINNFLEDDE
jgi:spermidine synthase